MTRLVLINGAPGSGKSTIAHALAQDRSLTLALDIDGIKHSLGCWEEDPLASGLHARRLTLALANEQLNAGFDVVIGQYLARTPFIEDLERLAEQHGARFCEFVLNLDAAALAKRLAERASNPDRLEHAFNNRLVGPEDARRARSNDRATSAVPPPRMLGGCGRFPFRDTRHLAGRTRRIDALTCRASLLPMNER